MMRRRLQYYEIFKSLEHPLHQSSISITPDLIPREWEANKSLHSELAERSQSGNHYKIKNGQIVQRKE